MFNIIEKKVKLNMKTETREERTLDTLMVADGMRQGLLLPWDARHKSSFSPKIAAMGPLYGGARWRNGCVVWWLAARLISETIDE